eukprot:TRINITY_DN143_c0_g1_i1.p1 TRINITY_DN143_c0_g1~~TRINITY_DN143_c0_g1_i1.p1  ORF type:complete len:303 (-),score=79.13 TRINITY_DN143_c0_g1_i1:131-1039(-)
MRSSSLISLCGLVLVFLFVHSSTSEDVFSPVPLMMWAGSPKFGEGQNLQTLDSSKVEQIFKTALTSGVEVVVVFVEPRMSTENVWDSESFQNLQELTKQSATIYPYVSTENKGVATTLAGVLAQSNSGKIILAEDQPSGFLASLSLEKVTREQLLALVRKSNPIFNNGVTDVIVVNFDSKTDNIFGFGADLIRDFSEDDQYMKSVVDAVAARTSKKYLAVFTADKPYRSTVSRTPSEVESHKKFLVRDTPTDGIYNSYFPIFMLEVYIAVIVMLIIAFIGILCTCSLQSPARFENPNKHKKE